MTKFFFESYEPEIHWKLHKWCCGCTLKLFRLFRAKNKFCINFSFFEFFCISGVMHFFREITKFFFETYGPEIHQKLHKWCCGRFLKLFRLFRAKKKFCINFSFFEFFCISGVMHFFREITKFFFETYGPEIHQKLHKWCCGRILKLFRLFRAKKKFCINFSFFEFFCIPRFMHFF